MSTPILTLLFVAISISFSASFSHAQPQSEAPNDTCNGIVITYTYKGGRQLLPTLVPSDPEGQPYRFEANFTVLNAGIENLKNWKVFVGFQHREFLVSASNAVLSDGNFLPGDVSNGTVFSGSPVTDLKTAVETGGDYGQMMATVDLAGTEYGIAPENNPLPSNLSLVNHGFSCSRDNMIQGNNVKKVCCTRNPNAPNATTDDISPLQDGDLSITYDVVSSSESNYWAQVTISNQDPMARLDYWQLSWEWMRGEFIYAMRGAYPALLDTGDCIFGPQNEHYQDLDFSKALNCERRPTIIDLPRDKTNDSNLGLVPFCCRNGTILPTMQDPMRSKSAFRMQVYKMAPDLNPSAINPPQNWRINATSGPEYACGQPIRVAPALFPNNQGLSSDISAIASWQIVCNFAKQQETITTKKNPKCCVSFSSFFNESVVPCNTCACGCSETQSTNTCNASAPPLLLPSELLLLPFDNRTKKTLAFADLHREKVPNPLPCGDNCGVSINWHLLSDAKDGWTARITLFNWGKTAIVDWSAAAELEKATPGLEEVYSFNGTVLPDSKNTVFLAGLSGLNYLNAQHQEGNPRKKPPVPGSQQSVIMFKKERTPGIQVARGDGYPTKVYFNGEECSVPTMLPISFAHGKKASSAAIAVILNLMILVTLCQYK